MILVPIYCCLLFLLFPSNSSHSNCSYQIFNTVIVTGVNLSIILGGQNMGGKGGNNLRKHRCFSIIEGAHALADPRSLCLWLLLILPSHYY